VTMRQVSPRRGAERSLVRQGKDTPELVAAALAMCQIPKFFSPAVGQSYYIYVSAEARIGKYHLAVARA
jgi:hypothetical protein